MIIIPAIDIIGNKCVRLKQGSFSGISTYGDPLETAKMLQDNGCTRLHLVDLDGARQQQATQLKTLESIARNTSLLVDFSGGIRTETTLQAVFDAGAAVAGIGSIAIQQPELLRRWLKRFGPEKIWLGADVRNNQVAVNGWQEQTTQDVFAFVEARQQEGITTLFCTDISKDGMLNGPSTTLYRRLCTAFPQLRIIASGGVSSVADIDALADAGCYAVIVGRALYEGNISFKQLKPYLV